MKLTDIEDIIDRTQGHLMMRWKASRGVDGATHIGLSSLYCIVALFFLATSSIQAFFHNRSEYGTILLFFAGLILSSYFYLRITGNSKTTNSFIVLLLGILCLFLLYTGGVGTMGPMWYYVFPLFAMFIQRLWAGTLSVLILLIITLYFFSHSLTGFDPVTYSQEFRQEFIAVYLAISIMAFLYAFMRTSSELDMDSVNRNLTDLANTDELTRLPNRRHMKEILSEEVDRTLRNNGRFSLIILDLDNFKNINDEYGHDCGDAVLRTTRGIFHSVLRGQDTCGRWGGEEFIILMPRTNLNGGKLVAERLRVAFEKNRIKFKGSEFSVTASLGVKEFNGDVKLDDCLQEADKNLYLAKAEGRNCVVAK